MAQAAAEEKTESTAHAAGGGAGGAAPSGGGSKLVLILTGVNLLATLGMVGVLFLSFQKERKKPSVEDIAAQTAAPAAGEHGEAKGGEHGGGEAKGGEHGGGGKAEHAKKSVDYGRMITLEQFTVNLSTPGSSNPKYVRVNISLEVPTDDAEGEVTSKMPQVRNAIIDLFNSKRPADLATAEGRDYLKEEIRNALNGFLVNGKVKGVFFTNFALTS
jgi:flagellar FliL protein